MDVKIDTNELIPAVGLLKKIVIKIEDMSILSSIIMETVNKIDYNLIFRSNNVELGVQVRIACQIKKPGKIVFSADTFYDLMINLGNLNLSFIKLEEDSKVFLKGTHYNAVTGILEYFENDFFEIFPDTKNLDFVSVDKRKFISSMEKTLYSISEDDNYYNMSGVYFHPRNKNSELTAVSMDGFRMSYIKYKYEIKKDKNISFYNKSAVLTKRSVLELLNLVRIKFIQNDSYFDVSIGLNYFIAKSYNVYLFIRILENDYPDFENIIPRFYKEEIIIKKEKILTSIKRVSSFSKDKKCSILFEFTINSVLLTYYDMGISKKGEINERLEILCSNNIVFLLNTKYLLESLNTFEEEYVFIKLLDEFSPIVISNQTNNHICLIMPIKGD